MFYWECGILGCERCGRCCISYGVSVTHLDIMRIARATGRKPSDFVAAIPDDPKMRAKRVVALIDGRRSVICLRWSRDCVCPFYTGSGCAAYDARPMVCRIYPFTVSWGRLVDSELRACPSRWRSENEAAYIADYKRYDGELEAYARIVKEWNRKGGSLSGFLGFALGKVKEAPD